MIMDTSLICRYCNKDDFSSSRALSQHQQRNKTCLAKLKAELAGDNEFQTAHEFISILPINMHASGRKPRPPPKTKTSRRSTVTSLVQNVGEVNKLPTINHNTVVDDDDANIFDVDLDMLSDDEDGFWGTTDETNQHADLIDRSMSRNFQEYCAHAKQHFVRFTKIEETAIGLMYTLRGTKASLDTYESVMEWHLRATGLLKPNETMGTCWDFVARKKLLDTLKTRYNTGNYYSQVEKITLPQSKARVNVIRNNAKAVMQSLITDPRIKDEDYWFLDHDDPFAPPTDDLDYIGDLHTGRSYIETYKKLITKPGKQILFPAPIYIDGCATGQFTALSITAVKLGNGLLTRKARDDPGRWRTLGYIPDYSKFKSRGRRLLLQSGHVDGIMAHQDVAPNEGAISDKKGKNKTNPQDFHTMLASVLEGFVELQNTGFIFDFYYRGKLYKDVEFILFVPFIKCDTDEADCLCGSYKARSSHVCHLCRYCHCPTQICDRPLADFPLKTMAEIQELIDNEDTEGLRAISQQLIQNATYLLRFGQHSDQGVHGSCPMEMLHALLLGIFKYIRDCFFEQIGPTSQLADEIDSLAKEYGTLLSRHSDRDLPKTKFSGGIRKGKLMAKEYPGILLCMVAVLRSTKGKELLSTGTSTEFKDPKLISDWILLVECMLEWEMWLKSDRMEKEHVERAKQKHRYIMYLIKKVGKRTKGMGLKITKFHAIMHMAMDILNFGVPMEVDTGSNESGHKPTKTAAKLTQRCEDTFDKQTSERLEEIHLLSLAFEEINGRPLWDYPQGYYYPGEMAVDVEPPSLGGGGFRCYFDEKLGHNAVQMTTRITGNEELRVESSLVDFVVDLQDAVSQFQKTVPLRTNHDRNGAKFRAHMQFRGGVWRDWVMVDWGDDGVLPNKIWGFVDLTKLPQDSGVDFGGLHNIQPGLYAIVESAAYSKSNADVDSQLFIGVRKEVQGMQNGFVTGMVFYLADVEAITEPAVVIPDIGGPTNGYFVVRGRSCWRDIFVKWLEAPHEDDEMSSYDEGDSDYEDDSIASSENLDDFIDHSDLDDDDAAK